MLAATLRKGESFHFDARERRIPACQTKRLVNSEFRVNTTCSHCATYAQDIDDDNMVQTVDFRNRVDGVMSLYRGNLKEKKIQRQPLPITMFLSKVKPPGSTVSASSRRVSE